ncbi:undecaprenyl-diphosphate phosphatase [Demequina sp. SYSU T00039]|uniref:Undecaprenyl-diphosphatase n=1 Tax=Demequina lignilytica TaxID=3051663 RepID=A0AAW7M9Z7_9MICO|nr:MULTISPECIES: undecaprenyl-diphosphate phosphatase [unclassified Demequina]MDN4479046.1 undecaprenyl-diphosphate phosphatase [Demequina sp. SYSU T00039-1]MDN4489035.1 undecaprenyl-diphosphate phosphatase [Demequina sp. SYSU T00039]MDN4491254.1 undecaprenyl-diphosphate phosphatase [Demequina sp. SYSU T00068]
MGWWEAVILGLVQGLTEFLPISSSAHIRVIGALLPHGTDPGAAFTAIIQIGTEAAVLVYFWKDIVRIVAAWFRALFGRDGSDWRARMGAHSSDARMGWFVILGSFPIVILGVLFKDAIETSLRNLYITAAVLALFAIVLWFADRVGSKRRQLDELTVKDAILLGFAQAMALIPGVSRSGGTITMGLLLGMTREAAARISFLLAIPAVLGSGFFELYTEWDTLGAAGSPGFVNTAIATVVAFGVGYAVIVWFLKLVSTHSYTPFVLYRIGASGAILGLLAAGAISAT